MKNFTYALVVFFSWGTVGILYLRHTHRVETPTIDRTGHHNNVLTGSSDVSPLQLDHSLLFAEMEPVAVQIKSEYSRAKANHILKNTFIDSIITDVQIDVLFPEYIQNGMKPTDQLISYAKELQDRLKHQPGMKITLVGHYYGEDKGMDNYLEALSIAKNLKNYLINSFKIPVENISAISEGDSRPLTRNEAEKLHQKTRIEIMTEKLD